MDFYYVADDDLTRVTLFKYCVNKYLFATGRYEHFRGFEVGITSPTSGYSSRVFGTVDDNEFGTICNTVDTSNEELMFVTIFADLNDVEGMIWEGNFGTTWTMRANGEENERRQMGGRPIGFRVYMGDGGMPYQPLRLSIFFNACNCPASEYIGNNLFNDMTIEAVVGAP